MTKKLEIIEQLRYKKQIEIDAQKSLVYRNTMGQYSTPRNLADDILKYAKSLNITDDVVRFLDPAFGMGSFYTAFLKVFGEKGIGLGFEIDHDYFRAANDVWIEQIETGKLLLQEADFTNAKVHDYAKANLFVCNPPYSRHQHIDTETKYRLKDAVRKVTGRSISGLAGLHAYFMLLSHAWLKDEAISIWLIPSEIFEVNYGKVIKDYLLEDVQLERIHFFDHAVGQFDDALVSSSIVVFRKTHSSPGHLVEITSGNDFLKPEYSQKIEHAQLATSDKWTKRLSYQAFEGQVQHDSRLGNVFDIKRGIATGNNNFFTLTKEQAEALEIPRQYLKNVLPPARYINTNIVKNDADGYLDVEKKLVLLNINLPIDEIKIKYPKLYVYLIEGQNKGVHLSYINSRRNPWYSQEQRAVPDYFVRYMSREHRTGEGKPMFIENHSDAIATNGYLMMYEKQTLFKPRIDMTNILQQLNKNARKAIIEYGRSYGGGLTKIEPKELKQVPFVFGLS